MCWIVGVTFVIAVIALLLHLRPLVAVAPPPGAPSASVESLGARLQRECESVVDTANVRVTAYEVFMFLEDPPHSNKTRT